MKLTQSYVENFPRKILLFLFGTFCTNLPRYNFNDTFKVVNNTTANATVNNTTANATVNNTTANATVNNTTANATVNNTTATRQDRLWPKQGSNGHARRSVK